MYEIEVNDTLSSTETVDLLKAHYFNEAEGKHFEQLVNENRRAIIRRAWQTGDYKTFGNLLKYASDGMFRDELAAWLHGGEDTLIQTRGSYMYFLRRCLGKSNYTSAAKALLINPNIMRIYEDYSADAKNIAPLMTA